eukprot:gene23618-20365_t
MRIPCQIPQRSPPRALSGGPYWSAELRDVTQQRFDAWVRANPVDPTAVLAAYNATLPEQGAGK